MSKLYSYSNNWAPTHHAFDADPVAEPDIDGLYASSNLLSLFSSSSLVVDDTTNSIDSLFSSRRSRHTYDRIDAEQDSGSSTESVSSTDDARKNKSSPSSSSSAMSPLQLASYVPSSSHRKSSSSSSSSNADGKRKKTSKSRRRHKKTRPIN